MIFDTIVAPITGSQPAAVAVVRLSGPEAWQIAATLFDPWPTHPSNLRAVYGRLATGDEGMALPFAEGHGYTGDQSVEFSIHGSPASVRALIEVCISKGARMANPGEFTQRAFLNGKLDLTQAEGVKDTVEAETEAQFRQANLHRDGVLRRQVSNLRAEILSLLAKVEASVDFSEEIGDLDRAAAQSVLQSVCSELEKLLRTASAGRILRSGFRIAIVGPPNAGKSSLLNALLGMDRSIVTDVPGTTRDYVEEHAEIGGVRCVLFDTAGLRESTERVESIGIQRARTIAGAADEIWYVYDLKAGWSQEDEDAIGGFDRPVVILANKVDLAGDFENKAGQISISALTRQGFEALIENVGERIRHADSQVFINQRHETPLREALERVQECAASLRYDLPDDLLSVGLSDAASRLGEITGETATVDIIEKIFHDFCIGK